MSLNNLNIYFSQNNLEQSALLCKNSINLNNEQKQNSWKESLFINDRGSNLFSESIIINEKLEREDDNNNNLFQSSEFSEDKNKIMLSKIMDDSRKNKGLSKCNGNLNCQFKEEGQEPHFMRLKSKIDKKQDLYIFSCCLNQNYFQKVLEILESNERGTFLNDYDTCDMKIISVKKNAKVDFNDFNKSVRNKSIKIENNDLEKNKKNISNNLSNNDMGLNMNFISRINKIQNEIIKGFSSSKKECLNLNLANSMKNLNENETSNMKTSKLRSKNKIVLMNSKNGICYLQSQKSNEIFFKSNTEIIPKENSLEALNSQSKYFQNPLKSKDHLLEKRSFDELDFNVKSIQNKLVKKDKMHKTFNIELSTFPFKNEQIENTRIPEERNILSKLISNKKTKKEDSCCKCAKSMCLKLYCQCFAAGRICKNDCSCNNCHNLPQYKELINLVILDTKEKNPEAFNSKYKKREEGEKQIVHSRGCNCKTGCVKKYCECLKAGTGCSALCKCSNCENDKILINQEEVPNLFVKVLRKRKRRNVLGEFIKSKGKMSYEKFIDDMKKAIYNQKKRKRKTTSTQIPIINNKELMQKSKPNNKVPLLQNKNKKHNCGFNNKKKNDNVFVESSILSDSKLTN